MPWPEDIVKLGNTSRYDPLTDESLQSLIGFRLKPRADKVIHSSRVKRVIRDVQHASLDGNTWHDLNPKLVCTNISDEIRVGVGDVFKSIHDDYCRYKYIVQTHITEFGSQSVNVSIRCLWDENTDRIVYENYINDFIVCSSAVIFVYFY